MGIENENFVLVGSLNTLSLVYMTEYYNNNKMIHTSMFQKHIHKVRFYPSADDFFTQASLVMLVTNIMSDSNINFVWAIQLTFPLKYCYEYPQVPHEVISDKFESWVGLSILLCNWLNNIWTRQIDKTNEISGCSAHDLETIHCNYLKQARKSRSYTSSKLSPCQLLTEVMCRATSVAKNVTRAISHCFQKTTRGSTWWKAVKTWSHQKAEVGCHLATLCISFAQIHSKQGHHHAPHLSSPSHIQQKLKVKLSLWYKTSYCLVTFCYALSRKNVLKLLEL